ncbi:type II secretion system F family protein [Sulfurimonas sp. HSL-1716]|uniref:type II secretion system F family protein n=1 Tax=Hydrocurvibacter sulfurireducens TaxID=3131937 RepID=UPI0031F8903D
MIYKYKGIDADGNKVKAKVEASSLTEAKSKLAAQNIIYESVSEDNKTLFEGFSFVRKYKIPPKELSSLSRELATYIRSGISIVSALKIVKTHYENDKRMKLFLNSVSTYLDEGKNFYTALQTQNVAILPEFYKESIKVSEDGGILEEVLMELSRFLKEQEKLHKEIKSAFMYPGFMIAVSFFMISFMLAFVVPQITGIFKSLNQELPGATKAVIWTGEFFEANVVHMIILFFVVIFLFLFLMKKSQSFAYFFHRLLLRLPLFGKITQKSELARFAYIASLLVRSGVPFVQTVQLSANILNNTVLKGVFNSAATKVVEGKLLSNALNNASFKVDYAFVQAVALGEETSQLQNVLSNISELYFEENRDKTSMMLTLLEPLLMLFVGGTIGFIVSAMLLPIFSMSIS